MSPADPQLRDPAPPGDPVVELRDVSIGYDERPFVRHATLSIARGEVVALIGANGSGKSTLVRGLLGLAAVLEGEVLLFGEPVRRSHDRYRIGYVPQRHTVGGAVPSTVDEVVSSGRLARRPWWRPATRADRAAVDAAIDAVGLTERRRAAVSALSGGQQRRALIARALAGGPEVLVMDEPTAGVDAESQAALVHTLARLVADGLTLLIVTHEIAPLLPLLTREITMDGGRVVTDRPLGAGPAAPTAGLQHPVLDHRAALDAGHDPLHLAPLPAGHPERRTRTQGSGLVPHPDLEP